MTREKNRLESKNRNTTIDQNMILWCGMKCGTIDNCILRIKMDPTHNNGTLRDPTIYRCIDMPHQHTGDTYLVYPTYDFACPIVDSLEGVTHVYRSVEFKDRDPQYKWILNMFNLRKPVLCNYSRITFRDTVLSKRKIKRYIDDEILEGWNDPRLLTLRGAFRRGLSYDGLIKFISQQGLSRKNVNMTQDTLWGNNRKIVDKLSTMYIVLESKIYTPIEIVGNTTNIKEIFRCNSNRKLGKRILYYGSSVYMKISDIEDLTNGEEITLIDWGNLIYMDGILHYNPDGDVRTTNKKLLWICDRIDELTVPIKIVSYNGLTDPSVVKYYIGDPDMRNIVKRQYIRLNQMGYYICDVPYDGHNILVLIEVP